MFTLKVYTNWKYDKNGNKVLKPHFQYFLERIGLIK